MPDAQIYVFAGPLEQTVAVLLAANLRPVLNSAQQVQLWRERGLGRAAAAHIDTGMNRLGFAAHEFCAEDLAGVHVNLLLTHLARADEPGHSSVGLQLQGFAQCAQLLPGVALSVGNSAGTLVANVIEPLADLGRDIIARPGIALYGGEVCVPAELVAEHPHGVQLPTQCVATLLGQVLQVREVPAGEPVGYGGSYVTAQTQRLATIGLGYADGLPRLLSNQGYGFVGGHLCPIVGRVSMDLTVLDVSAVNLAPGDWVEFYGPNIPLGQVAAMAQTIDYEVLCAVGSRVLRQFRGASDL